MPGTITLKPIEANLNRDTDLIGKADPYCQFTIGGDKVKGQVCKSGGKHPVWYDSITIPASSQTLCLVEVKDKDLIKDDKMGSCEIDLRQIQNQGVTKQWYPLHHRGKPAGELLLEATFTPDNAHLGMPVKNPMGMQPGIQQGVQPGMQQGMQMGVQQGMPIGKNFTGGIPCSNGTQKTQVITKETKETTVINGVPSSTYSNVTYTNQPHGACLDAGLNRNTGYNCTQTAYPANNMNPSNQYAQEALSRGVNPLGTQLQYPQQIPGGQQLPQTNLGQQNYGTNTNQNLQNQMTFGQGNIPRKY